MSERLTHLWNRYERREEIAEDDDNLTIDEICELLNLQHAEILRLRKRFEEIIGPAISERRDSAHLNQLF